jgi:predicted TIM-barrel fold metal-dependent hydrolase
MNDIIDIHSHWGTRRGYALRTEQELAQQRKTWNSEPRYHTEAEMIQHFRENGVRTVLDFGFTKDLPPDEAAAMHDYAFEVQRSAMDSVLGHWIHIDPHTKAAGLKELRRCIDAAPAFLGFAVNGSGTGPASDPVWFPFYDLCIQARIPVLLFVGTTGLGAGLPGGNGILLDDCHPRHLDFVAARFPELRIVAARPGWPWQTETIAILMHKRNIWYDLHGWSPKYFTADLKHEISRRLRSRIMFGADYPLYTYERLKRDWLEQGFSPEVLQDVFHDNAARFLSEGVHA